MYRREFISNLEKLSKIAVAAYGVEILSSHSPDTNNPKRVSIESHQVGHSIDSDKARWYGFRPQEAYGNLLDLPTGRVRIVAPMSEVVLGENEFDFRAVREQIDRALTKGKAVDLQLGAKTYGGDEINLPRGMLTRNPYLKQPGVILDNVEEFRIVTRNYLKASVRDLIRNYPGIKSIHVENEALSKRLEVSLGRHISQEFLLEETRIVKDGDPFNRPLVQNPNWDTPEAALWLFTRPEFEIMAVNVYNNTDTFFRPFLWTWVDLIHKLCLVTGKKFAVSEYQTAYWLNIDKSPKFPYSEIEFQSGYQRLMALKPEFLHFWDAYQLFWGKQNNPRLKESHAFISSSDRLGLAA